MKTSKIFLAVLAASIAFTIPTLPLSAQNNQGGGNNAQNNQGGQNSAEEENESEVTVAVTNADGTVTRRAAVEGETVVAGPGQTIALEFLDGSSVTLAQNTSVSLSNLSAGSAGDVQVRVGYGTVAYNVPTTRTGKKIAISTALGTAEVSQGSGEVTLDFVAGEVKMDVKNNTPGGGGVQLKSQTGTETVATTDGSTKKNFDSDANETTEDVSEGQTLSIAATPAQANEVMEQNEFSTLVSNTTPTADPTPPADPTPTNPLADTDPVDTDDGDPLTGTVSPAGGA